MPLRGAFERTRLQSAYKLHCEIEAEDIKELHSTLLNDKLRATLVEIHGLYERAQKKVYLKTGTHYCSEDFYYQLRFQCEIFYSNLCLFYLQHEKLIRCYDGCIKTINNMILFKNTYFNKVFKNYSSYEIIGLITC